MFKNRTGAIANNAILYSFEDVEIKGWIDLSPEVQQQCLAKLQYARQRFFPGVRERSGKLTALSDLVHQRDENAKAVAVSPTDLEDRLNQIQSSRSPTPILSPYDPDKPAEREKIWTIETAAHEALVAQRGRPCYPLTLGLAVFDDPGQYEDILECWEGLGRDRFVFTSQLERWTKFRDFQRRNRHYFPPRGIFFRLQQEVVERRQRHGLDGDPQLLEEHDKQTELDDWMEYQDFELRKYEMLEKDLQEDRGEAASGRKALAEWGMSVEEGVEELEFAAYLGLTLECDGEAAPLKKQERLLEHKLRLAEARLRVAQSKKLGEEVTQAAWENTFLEEIELAQARTESLHCEAEIAKRELQPFTDWHQAKQVHWAKQRSADWDEGGRLNAKETESKEHKEKFRRYTELQKQDHEAGLAHFQATREVQFAKEVYDTACLDIQWDATQGSFKKTALIAILEEEMRVTTKRCEEAKAAGEKFTLKKKVIDLLAAIFTARTKVDRQKVLLQWIEEQRCEIIGIQCQKETVTCPTQVREAASEVLENPSSGYESSFHGIPNTNRDRRPSPQRKSILGPVGTAKISKTSSKKRSSRQKTNGVSRTVPEEATKKTTVSTTSNTTRRQSPPTANEVIPDSLTTVKSSRVSKRGRGRPPQSKTEGTKIVPTRRGIRQNKDGDSPASSIRTPGKKGKLQDTNVQQRRSSRISKPPDWFRPAMI
ncbi:MAG: hypothetical protein Q9222_004342 [Ikaeria aurantiellina]